MTEPTRAEIKHDKAVADEVAATESHEAISTRRWVATIVVVVLLAGGVFAITSIIHNVPKNTEKIDHVCELARRQNDVLLRYGAILTTPIPIPPDAGPALAKAIADRNQQFAAAGEFARKHARDFSCPPDP